MPSHATRLLAGHGQNVQSACEGFVMKLSFAIATIMAVLVATTLEICLSGAVTRCNSEYGSAKATIMTWVAPRAIACR
jgi:hypothetical protein